MFDCFKLHSKCKALCCKCAPIEKEIYDRNRHRLVTKPPHELQFVGYDKLEKVYRALVLPLTEDAYCPFLNKDYSCAIQDDKPSLCRKYGNEEDPNLRCPFQDRNGRVRSRQETRKITRECQKETDQQFRASNKLGLLNE